MRTNSSAYNGFPPARSRRSCCVSAGSTVCSSSAETSFAVSVSDSGERLILERGRRFESVSYANVPSLLSGGLKT
jgi:hypothetical protein